MTDGAAYFSRIPVSTFYVTKKQYGDAAGVTVFYAYRLCTPSN